MQIIVAVAVCTLLVGELGVRAIASKLPDPQRWSGPEMQLKQSQIDELAEEGGASVVFIGSSTVDAGVDPSAIVDPAATRPLYNAATGAGSLRMIATWARHIAIPRLKPDVVVLGLQSRELNPNDPEQARLERDFVASPAVEEILGTESWLERVERAVEERSRLFEYRTVLRDPRLVVNSLRGDPTAGRTYGDVVATDGQYGGFLDARYQPSVAVERLIRRRALNRFEVGRAERMALQRLVEFLAADGRQLVVLSMPVTADYVRFHPDGQADQDEAVATLQAAAASVSARFVDVGVWPDELFADPAHLNAAGAQRLTEVLVAEVAAIRTGSR
jgi:hypothetical protein